MCREEAAVNSDLIARAQAGDEEAFRHLVSRHQRLTKAYGTGESNVGPPPPHDSDPTANQAPSLNPARRLHQGKQP
jgi:hypothetical protein